MTTLKVALLAVILGVAGGLAGTTIGNTTYAGSSISVLVTPMAPTEADAVAIEVAGDLPNACYEVSSSHVVTGTSILITVDIVSTGGFCALVLGYFSASEEIGQLAAGSYFVQAIVNVPCCFPCSPSPCVETTTLEVAGLPVGGIAELPEGSSAGPLDASASSGLSAGMITGTLAAAAGIVALAGATWLVSRRRPG